MFGFRRKKIFWTNHSLSAVFIPCCPYWARWQVGDGTFCGPCSRGFHFKALKQSAVFEMPHKGRRNFFQKKKKRRLQCGKGFSGHEARRILCTHEAWVCIAVEVFTHWSKTCCAFVMCFHTGQWNSAVRRCNFIGKWSLVEIIFW